MSERELLQLAELLEIGLPEEELTEINNAVNHPLTMKSKYIGHLELMTAYNKYKYTQTSSHKIWSYRYTIAANGVHEVLKLCKGLFTIPHINVRAEYLFYLKVHMINLKVHSDSIFIDRYVTPDERQIKETIEANAKTVEYLKVIIEESIKLLTKRNQKDTVEDIRKITSGTSKHEAIELSKRKTEIYVHIYETVLNAANEPVIHSKIYTLWYYRCPKIIEGIYLMNLILNDIIRKKESTKKSFAEILETTFKDNGSNSLNKFAFTATYHLKWVAGRNGVYSSCY